MWLVVILVVPSLIFLPNKSLRNKIFLPSSRGELSENIAVMCRKVVNREYAKHQAKLACASVVI